MQRREFCIGTRLFLAKRLKCCFIANALQPLVSNRMQLPFGRWLAGMCCMLVLLAGTLASNACWHHELLHGADDTRCGAEHHPWDSDGSGHGEDASCAACAFAQQQVATGYSEPVLLPVSLPTGVGEGAVPRTAVRDVVWPEPSGRGPPAGV